MQSTLEQQRGEGRHLGWLDDDGIPRGERWDGVPYRIDERVVPGPDHADDAERAVADDHLAAEDEGVEAVDPLVRKPFRRLLRPKAKRVGAVGDLDEHGVLARLARFARDRVRDFVRVVDQPLLRAFEDAATTLVAQRLPARLG